MYRVCDRKSVFDVDGRKESGEVVKGLKEKTIDTLLAAGIIEAFETTPKTKKKGVKTRVTGD
jgi:hypothetical protein